MKWRMSTAKVVGDGDTGLVRRYQLRPMTKMVTVLWRALSRDFTECPCIGSVLADH
jgi:hypothetical protein